MNHSNPFSKQKQKKQKEAIDVPLEKFKPQKPRLSKGSAKALVESSCSASEIMWIERWLTNLVQERSLPPQICGVDAFDALTQYLAPADVLKILDTIRADFLTAHPQRNPPKDDFDFLLAVVGVE